MAVLAVPRCPNNAFATSPTAVKASSVTTEKNEAKTQDSRKNSVAMSPDVDERLGQVAASSRS
eukprot:CAMPEP_0177266962 /NCGR_PEP_ID=MMETSP0367-20130122/62974_1 /TAXON_ID=447022 ORGANISM="Scrippsiella hangoei-like, Strain SHHI-4" /NCGR_SAMPLE_ID=MMETSP0367 /ASSEMBLY_ACC=CAM_ASM_000362 /LENGTH=62 /DNA_ID=CAMNT_0018722387 /DNA_START=14 /DNA_END=199 /DNA_ORIENTATION=+